MKRKSDDRLKMYRGGPRIRQQHSPQPRLVPSVTHPALPCHSPCYPLLRLKQQLLPAHAREWKLSKSRLVFYIGLLYKVAINVHRSMHSLIHQLTLTKMSQDVERKFCALRITSPNVCFRDQPRCFFGIFSPNLFQSRRHLHPIYSILSSILSSSLDLTFVPASPRWTMV